MGKCVDCGFSISRQKPKGAYKLICTCNRKCRRCGDSCSEYWNADEMKKFIDETIPLVNDSGIDG